MGDINGNLNLPSDTSKLYLGQAQDSSITYDGTNLIIDAQEVGTGTIVLDNLPTSDPSVLNGLWNDSGTLKMSAG